VPFRAIARHIVVAMAEIRRAGLDDATAIAEVHVASWRGAYAELLPQSLLDALSVERRADQWRDQLADPEQTTLVAVDGLRGVVGLASVGESRDTDTDASTGELSAIYLHPSVWGVGLGRALHEAAVAALSHRYRAAKLWVLDSNTRAQVFYERQGWVADGAVKVDRRGDAVLNELRYHRALGGLGAH